MRIDLLAKVLTSISNVLRRLGQRSLNFQV